MSPLRSLLIASLVAATTLFAIQSSALAHHHDTEKVDVDFQTLSVDYSKGLVTVDYEITRHDWQLLEARDISPLLDFYSLTESGDEYAFFVEIGLETRSDQITFDISHHLHKANGIELRLASHCEAISSRTLEFATGIDLTKDVTVQADFSHHSSHSASSRNSRRSSNRRSWYRNTTSTAQSESRATCSHSAHRHSRRSDSYGCDRHHSQRSDSASNSARTDGYYERRSDRHSRHHDSNKNSKRHSMDHRIEEGQIRAAIVDACADHTSFESDRQHCQTQARRLPSYEAVDTITACAENTSFSSHFKSCMETAVDLSAPRADTIAACGAATDFGSHFQSCLDAATEYDYDASQVIASCGNSTDFSSRVPTCVQTAR